MTIKSKLYSCVALVGMICGVAMPGQAYILIDFLLAPQPTPVTDPTSLIPQTLVTNVQTVLKAYTAVEEKLQAEIQKLTAATQSAGLNITLESGENMGAVADKLLTLDPVTEKYVGVPAKTLAQESEKIVTSTAGTIQGIQEYNQMRRYEEQQAAIDVLAAALVQKKGADKIQKAFQEFNVEGGADYAEALEKNAIAIQMYNQMLNLEQQVISLRLQTASKQKMITAEPIAEALTQKAGSSSGK